eukprot:15201161-Heterocapsa_arctica.AAC.1
MSDDDIGNVNNNMFQFNDIIISSTESTRTRVSWSRTASDWRKWEDGEPPHDDSLIKLDCR